MKISVTGHPLKVASSQENACLPGRIDLETELAKAPSVVHSGGVFWFSNDILEVVPN
jgi:hypothetical protein